MKHTLEYKILKHLSENNNGRFMDVSEIESDFDFLKSVISDLKKRELILTEPYPSSPMVGDWIGVVPSDKPEKCKIKLSGIEYLDSLEKTEVDFELAKKTLEEFPRTKWFARVGFFIGIGLAILELIKFLIPIMFPSDKI
ncbi:hypothetical protein [Pseudotamlana carrageenivorans]|uniref:Uncharacterized protein n=1 Tax=Pseudotamlana carrageenivorans TaxID=2069432 RepID=A0A2I7SLP9_9FLAO|nr:hypothetical protein [Tamlana carrageenivorans]AUS06833.1 hypothetical protein C1A40_15900 [Tamlana carrageenivorans]